MPHAVVYQPGGGGCLRCGLGGLRKRLGNGWDMARTRLRRGWEAAGMWLGRG